MENYLRMKENQGLQLSIIVPVYNVEKYIRSCLESIFRQGLDENIFEVIIVNDGTKDRSMEVIQDIIEQHQNIIVLNQRNQGVSVARNNGIAIAKGRYILMPDADDLLVENSLKPLLEKALKTNVDLLVADFISLNDTEIDNYEHHQPQINKKEPKSKFMTGQQLILEDLVPYECYVWRTLFQKDFLKRNDIKFVPNITYQDRPFTHHCYLKAIKCLRIFFTFYIYRKDHSTATSYILTPQKAFDYCISIAKTLELTNNEQPIQIQNKIKNNVFKCYSSLMRRTIHEIRPHKNRTAVIDFLNQIAPKLEFKDGFKQRLVTFLTKNMPHTSVIIYYIYIIYFEERLSPLFKQSIRRVCSCGRLFHK